MNALHSLVLLSALISVTATAQTENYRGIQYTPITFDNNLDVNGKPYLIWETVKPAEESDLSIQNAKIDAEISREKTAQVKTGYLPTPSLGVNAIQGKNQPFFPGNSRILVETVGVKQRVYDASFNSSVKAAKLSEKRQDATLSGTKQDAYLKLASNYVNLLVARYRVSLAIQSYFTWTKFMDGEFANSNPSEADKQEARIYEMRIFNEKHNSMEELGKLHLKYKEESSYSLNDVLLREPIPLNSTWTLEEAVGVALQNNPQYLTRRLDEELSDVSKEKLNRQGLPTVNANAGYGRLQTPGPKGAWQDYDLNSKNYFVGLSVNVDLNFPERKYAGRVLDLEKRKAQNQSELVRRSIEKEIASTFNSYTQNVAGLNRECGALNPLILQYNKYAETYIAHGNIRLQDVLRYRSDLFQRADEMIVRFGRMILDSFVLYQKLGLMNEERIESLTYAGDTVPTFGIQSKIHSNPADFRVEDSNALAKLLERCAKK